MDLTIGQVADLLSERGLNREKYDELSTKPFESLEGEYERREVRFVLQDDGTIVRVARAVQVLALSRNYKYLEVERLHDKKGLWVPSVRKKDYTFSETMRWAEEGRKPEESENALDAACWGAHEELGVKLKSSDFIPLPRRFGLPIDGLTPPVRSSTVYHGIKSQVFTVRLLVRAAKLPLLGPGRTVITDQSVRNDVMSIVERFPLKGVIEKSLGRHVSRHRGT